MQERELASARRSLGDAVQHSLVAISEDERSYLELGYRHTVYALLGLTDVDATDAETKDRLAAPIIGFVRRCRLRVLAVEKVLPLWEQYVPDDPTPRETVMAANQFVEDVYTGRMSEGATDRFVKEVIWPLDGYFDSYYSGERRVEGVEDARLPYVINCGECTERLLYDLMAEKELLEGITDGPIPSGILLGQSDLLATEAGGEPDYWGVEYFAATAYCGVRFDPWDVQDPANSAGMRDRFREFWTWWLQDAVPAAYRSAG